MPVGRLIQEEGGKEDAANITAAWNHIRKCLELKGRFVRYNVFSERYEFLHFRTECMHVFEQALLGRPVLGPSVGRSG